MWSFIVEGTGTMYLFSDKKKPGGVPGQIHHKTIR
jgi:hypothetical protein